MMEYTIKKLAQLAGISTRTLRYYDEIDLLKPARINSSKYRIYGKEEIDCLQQILFYKALGLELETIKSIITSPTFDKVQALKSHREKLLKKREQINLLIENVDKTLANHEGRIKMTDREKFTGFKEKLIDDNEKKYGKEIRQQYGDTQVEQSNKKIRNMTKAQYQEVQQLAKNIIKTLKKAVLTGNPESDLAQKCADLHRQWLCYYWDEYSKEAHANLAQMYVEDERFKAYYDKEQPGLAEFLRDAIIIYTKQN